MQKLFYISFIASTILVGQSFADFGATSVYTTDNANLGYNKMVNIYDNSLVFYANDEVKVVNLTDGSEKVILSSLNLSKGVEVVSKNGDFLVKDSIGNSYYDIYHYDSNGNKIDEFMNVYSDNIIHYNNSNIITSSNFIDGVAKIYEGNITSTEINGTKNFTAELNGTVDDSRFSMSENSIFVTTSHYYNDGERFYILDISNGNIVLNKNISDVNKNSFLYSGDSVYLADGTNQDVFSYNVSTGATNWTSYSFYTYKPSLSLIRDNSMLMLSYEQYPSYFELINF